MAEVAAEVFDIRTGRRVAEPAVAKPGKVEEDAFGRYVMSGGMRVPVRNGWKPGDLDPIEDWQTAQEVEREIQCGDGIAAEPFGWRNLFNATLSMTTSAAGWTTYTTTGEPGAVLWCAGAFCWAVASPFVAWNAADSTMLVVPLWCLALFGWTLFCMSLCESDASIRRKLATR